SILPRALDNGPCASANFRCRWRPFAIAAETESVESATELHRHRLTASSTSNINPSRGADPAQVVVAWFDKVAGPTSANSGAYPDLSDFGALSHDKSTRRFRLRANGNRQKRSRAWSAAQANGERRNRIQSVSRVVGTVPAGTAAATCRDQKRS